MEILQEVYLGNSVQDYLWVVGSLLFGFIFMRFFSRRISDILFKLLAKKTPELDKKKVYDLLVVPLEWLIMLIILYVCTSHIEFPEEWDIAPQSEFGLHLILNRVYLTFLLSVVTWIVLRVASFMGVVLIAKAEKTESKADDQAIVFLIEILRVIIVTIGIFMILGVVFKVDVAALIAGLGIGGLALALAAKESLENLLSSFFIFFDKPFLIGDLVEVNGVVGSVEKIGFRSTRLRTLEKSYLTLPNRQMIDNTLDNLSMRTFRRVSFTVGVTYDSTEEQIKSIVKGIQDLVDEHPNTNQDGEVHFTEFGASSLDIMVLYYIDTMDWSVFLRIKEEINYEIMRIVNDNGADFAFPTQTLIVENN